MRLLLDTHILLWSLSGKSLLPREAVAHIQKATEVYASVASLWEIAIKQSLGKITLDVPIEEIVPAITSSGFDILAIKAEHAVAIQSLPPLHRDPFDRMLVAQSLVEPLRLLTSDNALVQYGNTILFCK